MPASSRAPVGLPTRLLLAVIVVVADLVGAGVVLVFAAWVLPSGPLAEPARVLVTNLVAFGGYLGLAVPVGLVWGWRRLRVDGRLTGEQREARERQVVLQGPLRLVTVQATLWLLAVGLFSTLNAQFSLRLAGSVGATVLLGGITTCAVSYLLCQRTLRRAAARVLSVQPPTKLGVSRVGLRAMLSWALGTGVPMLGVLLAAVAALAYRDVSADQLAVIVLVLGGTALVVGMLITFFAARATADPVRAVSRALRKVEGGDLDTRIAVYDGTELGLLQAGFNRMADGLSERERIRDLFGRQVGQDVARDALERDVELGGQVRDVAVLFVDVVGSTTLASTRPPEEVVALLNDFFGVVVDVVEENSGWINKFEGDAALAVFGAPVELDDAAGCALAAGRKLADRLQRELSELTAAVGVSAGPAVAGNLGDARRYEYTVIGDPVNEAARLTELAKSTPGRVLASATAVERASSGGGEVLELGESTTLRGRSEPTRLAAPKDAASKDAAPKDTEPEDTGEAAEAAVAAGAGTERDGRTTN